MKSWNKFDGNYEDDVSLLIRYDKFVGEKSVPMESTKTDPRAMHKFE